MIEPLLDSKAHQEMQQLPVLAREEIRTWFHAPCLNAAEFTQVICSNAFLEQLRFCPNAGAREAQLLTAFSENVVSGELICGHLRTIAERIGLRLTRNWNDTCGEFAGRCDLHLGRNSMSMAAECLTRVDQVVRTRVAQAIRAAQSVGDRLALSAVMEDTFASAVLAMRLARHPMVRIPLFLVLALRAGLPFLIQQWRPVPQQLQAAITESMAAMADQIGDEFATEIRQRITDLHRWQHQAILEVVVRNASDRVGVIS